jgi:hypothetical protein
MYAKYKGDNTDGSCVSVVQEYCIPHGNGDGLPFLFTNWNIHPRIRVSISSLCHILRKISMNITRSVLWSTLNIESAYPSERAGIRLDGRGVGVRVSVGQDLSLLHVVQTGSGAHSASYTMGIRVLSSAVKLPGNEARNIQTQKPRIHGSVHPLSHTSLWRSV